ncbi:MAG: restriction endonuclease subunit S, partial [Candidatus Humimicrobiaceae bacterium]
MKSRVINEKNNKYIPIDWEVVKIKDIGNVFTGKTPSTLKSMYWNGDIPFITPEDMTGFKYVFKSKRYVTEAGAKQVSKILPKNTLIIVCIGSTIGKIAITSRESIVNQQINAVICDENVICEYIYYAIILSSSILKNLSGVAAVPIIKKSLFETFKILIPKKRSEQEKIAEILFTMDHSIDEVDGSITKTEKLKKGLMQRLFTKGIGQKEFKETEIGKIPKEWEIVEMKDIADINKEYIDPVRELPNKKFFYIDIDSVENETGVIKNLREIIGRKAP